MASATRNAILLLIFNATAWANYADNAASTPQTNVSMALHTADPGAGGSQSTSEAAYGSYARVNVARTSGGWTVTANSVSPVANIDFPTSTGSPSETHTYFSAGKTGGGASAILFSGTVTPNITMNAAGIMPRLTTATAMTIT
jgi:hypothetical protein